MDSLFRRLKYYGIGFGAGLVFVIFFFQNRGCSWLPDNRVKNSILDRILVLPDSESNQMKKFGLTKKDLTLVLNDGEVIFEESKKEGNPKVYVVEKNIASKGKTKFFFTLADESFISEIHFSEKNAKKTKYTSEGFGELIYFPADDNLVFPDSSQIVTCQQDELGLINPKDILKYLKKSGKIDYSKSNLSAKPKPEHHLIFKDNKGREIGCNVIWYKNKLNITNFSIPFKSKCN
jgi:hypothetical protein